MTDKNIFRKNFKKLKGSESGIAFAAKCNISESLLRSYLDGRSSPGLEKLLTIAEACNVSVGWLVAGEENTQPVEAALKLWEELAADSSAQAPIVKDLVSSEAITPPRIHPAAIALDAWLNDIEKTDSIRSATFLDELREQFPDFAEWVKKRASHNNLSSPPQNTHRKSA